MNDIRGGRVTCYLDDIRPLRSFGEGQDLLPLGHKKFILPLAGFRKIAPNCLREGTNVRILASRTVDLRSCSKQTWG